MVSIRSLLQISSLALVTAAFPIGAQEIANEGPVPTTALINVESNGNVPLDPAQLTLEVNGHESPITSVTAVKPEAAQVAILIDDGIGHGFDLQIKDVQSFIVQLPAATKVFVGYMENGTIRAGTTDGFTNDHTAAAQQVRVALSAPGISASPYFCLSEFVKHWPSNQRAPRFVLMITNGVDPYNGSTSPLNQDSPYVQTAQEDAQRAGVAVYSLYYRDAGMRGGSFSGQSYLQQVGDATGGRSLYQGTFNPVSFQPFLKEFNSAIASSYEIGFMASARKEKNGTLTRIKLKTTQRGIKVHAPDGVHPGVAE